jgi:phospholipase D1/2
VICGSANLNDRSQLGDHDSEIAIIISGPLDIQTTFNGATWSANSFASSLRRQIFRKHLGLLKPQDYREPDNNYFPITACPNTYDWDSPEDRAVADPLSDDFLDRWNETARTNTEVFGKVFHPVPHDSVRTWKQYDAWYEDLFRTPDPKDHSKPAGRYKVGHVVREEFPGGVAELKEWLSRVKGTLVEMPLLFLKDEDIAKEGLSLNAFTEEVYT